MSLKSPMIRLAPIDFENLPNHPSFESTSTIAKRPDLLSFALTLLNQGRALVLPTEFNLHFKHHSQKSSPPSNNEVEVLSNTIPASDLATLPWNDASKLPRPKPAELDDEHWYARRSYHHNLSVKRNSPGTASWDEFVFGLRDNHSENEAHFTPTIFDTRLACDWSEELNALLAARPSNDGGPKYSHATMTMREMCHKMPSVTSPRCFPVLVLTASISEMEFIAVTLPVDMRKFSGAFYSNKRNRKEGSEQTKKAVQLGMYVAIERVHRYPKTVEHTATDGAALSHGGGEAPAAVGKDGEPAKADGVAAAAASSKPRHSRSHVDGEVDEEIEWVMATASHTKGNIPVVMQRMGVPGAIVKDVGLFLKWIHKVPDEEVRKQVKGNTGASASGTATATTTA